MTGVKLKYQILKVQDAIWHTVGITGGTYNSRSEWIYNADGWATDNLEQGFVGVRPGNAIWQQDCRWLLYDGKFWFRDQEDMFVFYLANTP